MSNKDISLVIPTAVGASGGANESCANKVTSKLLSLHWEPIAEGNIVQDTVWNSIFSSPTPEEKSGKSPTQTPSRRTPLLRSHAKRRRASVGANMSNYLKENELEQLTSLFSKKAPVNTTIASNKSADNEKTKKINVFKVIDSTRSTNISIGLTSFRSSNLTIPQVLSAIDQFQMDILHDADLILRIKEMLPNESEFKSFSRIKSKDNDDSTTGITNPAELFLWNLCQISNLNKKVNGLLFANQFNIRITAVKDSVNSIASACEAIKCSIGLKEIMKSILAIGNAMNQSGSAISANNTMIKGFKVSSLLKLSQTKSTDGSSTVLDYLLQLLYERTQANSQDLKAMKAWQIDEDLQCVHACLKINMNELKNEMGLMKVEMNNIQTVLDHFKSSNSLMSVTALEEKLASMQSNYQQQQVIVNQCVTQCSDLCTYLSEDSAAIGMIFETLSTFIKSIQIAKTKLLANLKKQSKSKK